MEPLVDTVASSRSGRPMWPGWGKALKGLVWPGPLVALRLTLFPLVCVGLFATYSFWWLAARPSERDGVLKRTKRLGLKLGSYFYGLDVKIVGNLPKGLTEPMLVVGNHRTGIDTMVLHGALDGHSLAMGTLLKWPLFGRVARSLGTLFVDRTAAGSRVAAIRRLRAAFEGGGNVIVFPEGMIYHGDDVRPYRRGAFAAAVGRPVLCVGLAYTPGTEYLHDESMLMHLFRLLWWVRIPVGVAIGEPFVATSDTAATAAEARRRTVALVARARSAWETLEPGP